MLNNTSFLSKFLQNNRTLLIEHYEICTQFLRTHSIPYIPSNAGFFIWVDLSAYLEAMPGRTKVEKERTMNGKLLDAGVHLATSEAFYGEDYGWFRITFTVAKDTLELGLKRCVLHFPSDIRMVEAIGATEEPVTDNLTKIRLQN
jgi:DNA-binding transcriptional MocR family regulator